MTDTLSVIKEELAKLPPHNMSVTDSGDGFFELFETGQEINATIPFRVVRHDRDGIKTALYIGIKGLLSRKELIDQVYGQKAKEAAGDAP